MSSQPNLLQPPPLAAELVNLFALPQEAESILRSLLEEFSHLASKSGMPLARTWYWRQTWKSIAHLAGNGYRTAPWSTTAAIAGGILIRKLAGRLVEPAIFAVLGKYQVYEHHFRAYLFYASTGIDLGHLVAFLLVGFIVALAAKGREMVATTTLGLIYGAMAVVGSLAVLIRTGGDASLWRLTWYFADSFAMVLAGAIVRTRRAAPTIQPSIA